MASDSHRPDCEFGSELTAFRQGELSPERREEVSRHLEGCADCRTLLEEISSVFVTTGFLEDVAPSLRFRRHIEEMASAAWLQTPEPSGLLAFTTNALAFLLYRLQTSRRFRITALSVALHAALLFTVSLFVIPAVSRSIGHVASTEPPSSNASLPEESGLRHLGHAEHRRIRGAPPSRTERSFADGNELRPDDLVPTGPGVSLMPLRLPVAYLAVEGKTRILSEKAKRARLKECGDDPDVVLGSVAKGLGWLASAQRADGSWSGASAHLSSLQATTISLLAFFSEGISATRGPRTMRTAARKGLDFVLAEHGKPSTGTSAPLAARAATTRALTVLALIEGYELDIGRVPAARSRRLRTAIHGVVQQVLDAQLPGGGWSEDGSRTAGRLPSLLSALALAAARQARFPVHESAAESAFGRLAAWLRTSTPSKAAPSPSGLAFTAGSLYLEELLGLGGPLRDEQASTLSAAIAEPNGRGLHSGLFRLSAALAFHLRRGRMHERICRPVLHSQQKDGSWAAPRAPASAATGDPYATALNVLTLTAAYRTTV